MTNLWRAWKHFNQLYTQQHSQSAPDVRFCPSRQHVRPGFFHVRSASAVCFDNRKKRDAVEQISGAFHLKSFPIRIVRLRLSARTEARRTAWRRTRWMTSRPLIVSTCRLLSYRAHLLLVLGPLQNCLVWSSWLSRSKIKGLLKGFPILKSYIGHRAPTIGSVTCLGFNAPEVS